MNSTTDTLQPVAQAVAIPTAARERYDRERDESVRIFRGLAYGVGLSLPLWLAFGFGLYLLFS